MIGKITIRITNRNTSLEINAILDLFAGITEDFSLMYFEMILGSNIDSSVNKMSITVFCGIS